MTEAFNLSPPAVSNPDSRVPAGTCDTHTHVFGPLDRFPPLHPAVYPLPNADPQAHANFRESLGVDRAILVQPAVYGTDPSAILSAIEGANGALKGVAVAESADAPLEEWASRGIIGLRFTETRTQDGKRYPGSVGFETLRRLAPAMRAAGLQAHLWAPASVLVEQLDELRLLGLTLVIEHMGMIDIDAIEDEALANRMLGHVRDGDVWMKLVLCRLGRPDLAAADRLKKLHNRMISECPDRMLWGSDWPYVRLSPAPDAARMLDIFFEWTGDADLARRILVLNPQRLFGFAEEG